MEENIKKIKSKKNKEKDVILIDNIQANAPVKSINTTNNIKNDINIEEEEKKEIELKKKLKEERMKQIRDNKQSNRLIKDLVFQIQLLFSFSKKIDPKMLELLLKYLTEDNLKEILEERDSEGTCGNILCDNPNVNNGKDRYEYDYKHKKFYKNELNSLFCNIRCMQKYKDYNKVCEKFDYMIMAKEKTYFELAMIKDYFPNNSNIANISEIASRFIELNRLSLTPEKLSKIRLGLNKYLVDNIEELLNFDDIYKGINENVSKMFEENMKIDN